MGGEFARSLQDESRYDGAMDRLVSDRAKAEFNKRVEDIMRTYIIDGRLLKPYQQHHNPAERHVQDITPPGINNQMNKDWRSCVGRWSSKRWE